MATILHLSDLHIGRPYLPEVGEACVRAAAAIAPDVVVCSGDLVEWPDDDASWRDAEAFLGRLPAPLLVVPGNHDIPFFNPIERLLDPFRRFRAHVHPQLDRAVLVPGAVVVGLGSARSFCFDLGALAPAQLRFAASHFRAAQPGTLRVVAVHHGLRPRKVGNVRSHMWGARRALRGLAAMGAELVLTGHNHAPHAESIARPHGAPLVWSQAGTACSKRYRVPTCKRNAFTLIRTSHDRLELAWWFYDPGARAFVEEWRGGFPRALPAALGPA